MKNTLVAQFNDLKAVAGLFKENPGQIAAVIVEPIMMNIGICMPEPGYLEGLREICTREGALLIFDEVKTGAKLGRGGACEYFNIKADIVTLAKSIGGGFPLAAFAASKQVMDVIAQQKVFHAGTYATNPLVMAAGLATLREVLTPAGYAHIGKVSDALVSGYKQIVQKTGLEAYVESAGANGAMLLYRNKIRNYREWLAVDTDLWKLYWFGMLNRGVMAQPYWWDEQWTISVAHSMADVDRHLSAFEQVAPALAQAQQETMAHAGRHWVSSFPGPGSRKERLWLSRRPVVNRCLSTGNGRKVLPASAFLSMTLRPKKSSPKFPTPASPISTPQWPRRATPLTKVAGPKPPPRIEAASSSASRPSFAKKPRQLAELESRNCGKPIVESEYDIADAATCFEYYGGLANKVSGLVNPVPDNALSLSLKEPVGVAGQIIPWNYPIGMAAWKLAPALAAGCTCVLKPAEQTPLTMLKLAGWLAECWCTCRRSQCRDRAWGDGRRRHRRPSRCRQGRLHRIGCGGQADHEVGCRHPQAGHP